MNRAKISSITGLALAVLVAAIPFVEPGVQAVSKAEAAITLPADAAASTREGVASTRAKGEDNFTLTQVAEGVFAAIAKPGGLASGNAGFVIGDGGVLVVDTFFTPQAAEELMAEIAGRTSLPVKYALNTHYHLGLSGGNQIFSSRVIPIIAHSNVVAWQTTKNRRFLPPTEEIQKRKADAATRLAAIPEDQKDNRLQLERQIRRFDAMLEI